MLIPERRRRLLAEVRRRGSATVEELAEQFGVSGSTVRRDLGALHRDGLLTRARGGAVGAASISGVPAEPADQLEVKQRIGRRAADLVEDDSTVMILAGSTTDAMVQALHHRRLTVVTNGLSVACGLQHAADVSVVVLGGYLHRDQMTLLGPLAVASMSALHVDVMFAGAWGIDAKLGVTGNKIIQAGNHASMLEHADKLVVLADATKLGRRGPTMLVDIDSVDTMITDRAADPAQVAAIRDRQVRVEQV